MWNRFSVGRFGFVMGFAFVVGLVSSVASPARAQQGDTSLGGTDFGTRPVELAAPGPQLSRYVVVDLGTLDDFDTYARDINNFTEIVGTSSVYDSPATGYVRHGFHWQDGVMADLGHLHKGPTRAWGINQYGWITGWSEGRNGWPQPVYSLNGSWIPIAMPQISMVGGRATGINDSLYVAGNWYAANTFSYAFVWSPTIGFVDLSSGGTTGGTAWAVNEQNQVVGWEHVTGNCGPFTGPAPTIWEEQDDGEWGATNLPVLEENCSGAINQLNENGLAVGYSGFYNAVPAKWTRRNGTWYVTQLHGAGPAGGGAGSANDVNEIGQIVGSVLIQAYLWECGNSINLNTQIPSNSGWDLERAYGINDRGEIVGSGKLNGVGPRAFLLKPRDETIACP